jgi:hypothetical protein
MMRALPCPLCYPSTKLSSPLEDFAVEAEGALLQHEAPATTAGLPPLAPDTGEMRTRQQ